MSRRSDEAGAPRVEAAAVVELIPALRAFARSFCRNASDADDLVQETLAKAIANLDRFEPGTRLKSWLFTIMRNTFLTNVARARREGPAPAEPAAGPVQEATQEWSAQVRDVREAIARLPQPQREIVVLVAMLGVSYEEAAQICDCAVGTVKSRLSRARAALLAELGEEPDGSVESRRRRS